MPVGTRAVVKAMAPDELWQMGYRLVLANAYHLALRPGAELIEELGGVGRFMGFDGAVLTDSGGFQAMSLAKLNEVGPDGIRFRSHLDGSEFMLTPERAVEIQERIGSDLMMALDECTPYPAERVRAEASLELTARWAERCVGARRSTHQALFGIIQGGIYPELRRRSAAQITAMPFDGFATGGLAVGEPKERMLEMAALSATLLPEERARYLMGVARRRIWWRRRGWATTCSIACCRRAMRATAARTPATGASRSSNPCTPATPARSRTDADAAPVRPLAGRICAIYIFRVRFWRRAR